MRFDTYLLMRLDTYLRGDWVADVSLALMCGGVALCVRHLARKETWADSALVREYLRLREQRRRELDFLRSSLPPDVVVIAPIVASVLALSCAVFTSAWWSLGVASAWLPTMVLRALRKRRVQRIEVQVEGFLGAMARALSASPSLGEALEAATRACSGPIREELQVVLNELRLGHPLARALSDWTVRVKSRTLTMAISALLVGRQTGGQLPQVLQSAARALRELERLEGVLRTKTAEGRAQAMMISAVPVPLYLLIDHMDPSFFAPLRQGLMGQVIVFVSVALWIAAVLLAKKILAVRI